MAAAALVALIVSASILHTAMLLFVRSVGEHEVPDLVGLEISVARAEIERAGFTTVIEREVNTSDFGAGRVVSQRPPGGRTLRRGRKVHFTVSLGMRETELPRVVGLTLRQAGLDLQTAGFTEGGVRRVLHPKVEKGDVIAQDPPIGALGTEGQPVDLLVSNGISERRLRAPDVIGLLVDDARAALRQNGFDVSERLARDDPAPAGTVLDQFPAPGSPLARNSGVTLLVARGNAAP